MSQADNERSIIDLRIKLMSVLEGSQQLYDAYVVIDLLPTDYLYKEKAILLVKIQ